MGHKITSGCGNPRNTEGEIWDENSLARLGCAHFNWWDAG